MTVPSEHLLVLAACLFSIGVAGFLMRKNLIIVLMSIELILNAANLSFLAATRSHALSDFGGRTEIEGPLFALFVIVVAAVEAAVGLALVIALYRKKQTVVIDDVSDLKY